MGVKQKCSQEQEPNQPKKKTNPRKKPTPGRVPPQPNGPPDHRSHPAKKRKPTTQATTKRSSASRSVRSGKVKKIYGGHAEVAHYPTNQETPRQNENQATKTETEKTRWLPSNLTGTQLPKSFHASEWYLAVLRGRELQHNCNMQHELQQETLP